MINFDDVTKETIKIHLPNWLQIPYHPYRILIRSSVSGEKMHYFNLISHQLNIYKNYLYAKDPHEAKYQLLITKNESTGLKYINDYKAFSEYSDDMDNIY